MEKLKFLFDYFKYLKNPFTALAFKFGLKKRYNVKLKKSNEEMEITSIAMFNRFMYKLTLVKTNKLDEFVKYVKEITNDNEFVFIDNIKYYNIHSTHFKKRNNQDYTIHFEEYFCDDEWNMVDLQNRFVIDIGANVGDTALYFANHGANVIGFEPVKHLYELGLDNISANPNLKENITLINKAVGGNKGILSLENNNSTKDYTNKNDTYDVEVITISDVLNDYDFPPDVLKMDCEGCEFEIILNHDLSMFNDIIFEHHSSLTGKDYKPLIEKLKEENFKINTFSCNACTLSFDDVGIIHAYK